MKKIFYKFVHDERIEKQNAIVIWSLHNTHVKKKTNYSK